MTIQHVVCKRIVNLFSVEFKARFSFLLRFQFWQLPLCCQCTLPHRADITHFCCCIQLNHTAHMDRELPSYVQKIIPHQGNTLVIQVPQQNYHCDAHSILLLAFYTHCICGNVYFQIIISAIKRVGSSVIAARYLISEAISAHQTMFIQLFN